MVSQEMRWCLSFTGRRFVLSSLYIHSKINKLTDQYNVECNLVRCIRCKTPVKDTDAVLDAVRVGQEGLDKAEALQFSSALVIFITYIKMGDVII